MKDVLVVTETIRFPFKRYEWQIHFLKAKIYLIDWSQKKVVKSLSSPEAYHVEEYISLKRCYHYHGARGITSNEKYIFIAAQNVIFVYDYLFKLQRYIHDHYFNGIHEITWYEDKLYVTCAVTDMIVVLDEEGQVLQRFLLGESSHFSKEFGLKPRTLDNSLDYRIMHRCNRRHHVNSVYVNNTGIYAGFNFQGAFVKIFPHEEVLIRSTELESCHNAQFSPDGNYILINDTQHYSLQIFDSACTPIRTIDLRNFSLPIDFRKRKLFGENHEIRAGWLRGLTFSVIDKDVVFLGLSPTCIVAVNYLTGELVDFLKIRRNIWVTVHGIHNLSLCQKSRTNR